MMPKRIQRKRTKGWKMPPNTVYVGRPTRWGNPFKVFDYDSPNPHLNGVKAVEFYIELVKGWSKEKKQQAIDELRGKNLACWCPLDKPCHADVLLELANK